MGAVASGDLLCVANVDAAAADGGRGAAGCEAGGAGAGNAEAAARPVGAAGGGIPAVRRRSPQDVPGAGEELRRAVFGEARQPADGGAE